jgi:hypothetical protein
MLEIDKLCQELNGVDWFSQCGKAIEFETSFQVLPVRDWGEAIERCSDQSWEDTTLEAQNRLTEFLHKHHKAAYQHWNTIAIDAKARIISPLLDRVWRPFAENHGFAKLFLDCVSWDVLGAIMEHAFGDCAGRPQFSLELLQIYRAGHFPCGWSEWPAGKLHVF